jgi:adenosylmethionine-8-amino-7-oxononanoate aminotransferase
VEAETTESETMNPQVHDSEPDSRLWHPFAPMGEVRHGEFVVTRAEDVWLWDDQERRYYDATASLWYANVGHGRGEIADAIATQLAALETYSIFNDFSNRPAEELAGRLSELSPLPDARVFLSSGGGDSIDTAAKLARQYWSATGERERVHLISRTSGYHGTHGFGTSLGGMQANREGWGSLHADVSVIRYDSLDAFERELETIGADRVAAIFVEPVIGAGGVLPPPPGYLEGVAEICRRTGVLLIVDAVICAFGRLGTWFGIERWDVEPDMIVFAKGVTSGYLPLGGVIVNGRVSEPFWSRPDSPALHHGQTYSGHATCCAAALANLELLERDDLLAQGRRLEGDLQSAFECLAEHPLVAEVRAGLGLMAAVELTPEAIAAGATPMQAFKRVREHGVLVRPLGASLAVSPPLTAQPEHFSLIADAILRGLEDLGAMERSGP